MIAPALNRIANVKSPVSSSMTEGMTFGISPQPSAASVRSLITRPLRPAISWFFRHRHKQLQRHFGGSPAL